MGVKFRKNPLGPALKLTAAAFAVSVAVWFVTARGEISLFGLFDRLFNGEEGDVYNGGVTVNVFSENDSYSLDIDLLMEKTLFDFFRLYYGGLGELSACKLKTVYTPSSTAGLLDSEYNAYRIAQTAKAPVPLTFSACDVSVRYVSSGFAADAAEIELTENFAVSFNGVPGTVSSEAGINHFFVLKKAGDNWLIDRHEVDTKQNKFINGALNEKIRQDGLEPWGMSPSFLEKYTDALYAVLGLEFEHPENNARDFSPDNGYDRTAAVSYALTWTSRNRKIRNLTEYAEFDDNCVNFTSQCLFAGGITMDSQGDFKWTWRGADEYSRSWIDGDAFFNYINRDYQSEGFGLVAAATTLEQAEKGDIVQFLDVSGSVIWQGIITGIAQGENGAEPLVTGNSGDIRNFPVHALGFGRARVIKIFGYND